MSTTDFRQAVMAEYIGTFMFLFCTIGCVVFTQDGGITTARALEVSLMFGGMITILVFIMGGISGGNINPAVSLALALTKKISPFRCVAYTIAQCLGAICGAGMVRIMTPALFDKVDGGANEISSNATPTVSTRTIQFWGPWCLYSSGPKKWGGGYLKHLPLVLDGGIFPLFLSPQD